MTAPFDVTGVWLETERLILRPWAMADLFDFLDYASDPAVTRSAGWEPCTALDQGNALVGSYIKNRETFALVLKETGRVIGSFSVQARPWEIYPINRTLRGREYGFDLSRKYWGRGLMPEAVAAVTDHCFCALGYDFITCGHFRGNDQSRRVIEKCGFTHLFDARRTLPNGKTFDISTYIQYNPHKGEITNV